MKLLFLRGKLPLDFRPDRLEYNRIDECEDMWTVFCERLSRHFDKTELWYWGGNKKKKVTDKFTERWVENFKKTPDFNPDVIMARGGFNEYLPVCEKFSSAKMIYYGAGIRFRPTGGKWDIVLVDSKKQQKKLPGSTLFVKPAADNIFFPREVEKAYDICFMANSSQADIKRHKLAFRAFKGSSLRVLHLGLSDDRIKAYADGSKVKFKGWHRRPKLPKLISQCRVGLVCSTSYDSCPRVLPELLACGLPVVATDNMNFWHEKYINERTGILCPDGEIKKSCKEILHNLDKYDPRGYYDENISLDVSSKRLVEIINAHML